MKLLQLNSLPHETFTIQVQESIPVLCQKILLQVEDFSVRPNPEERAVFTGQVSEHGFKISRIINYQNPLLPIIYGRFEAISGGTIIHVEIKLKPTMNRFLHFYYVVYFGIVLLIFAPLILRILGAFKLVTISFSASPGVLTPLVLLMLFTEIQVLPHIFRRSFWNEVKLDRSKLKQIFCEDRM